MQIFIFFAKKFDEILYFTIFLDSFGMAASAASIFWIRRRTKHLDNTGIYKMKLYPIQPIIFICAYLFVAVSIAITTPKAAYISLAVLGVCMGIYFVMKRGKSGGAQEQF